MAVKRKRVNATTKRKRPKMRTSSNWSVNALIRNARTFPSKMKSYARYCDGPYSLDAAAGGLSNQIFRLNSLYDPDFTGLGHQASGLDQMANLYKTYTVVRTKFEIIGCNIGSTQLMVGYYISDAGGGAGDMRFAREQTPGNSKICDSSGNGTSLKFSGSWDAKKWFSRDPLTDDTLQAAITTNPSQQAYLVVYAGAADSGATDPPAFRFHIKIIYECQYSEPQDISLS